MAQAAPGLMIYRFTHSMYYANATQLRDEVLGLASRTDPPVRWVCIDASAVDDVDFTAAETLRSLHKSLDARGIRLVVAQVLDDVRAQARRQLGDLFGAVGVFETPQDVMHAHARVRATADYASG